MFKASVLALGLAGFAAADTPASCFYNTTVGTWNFYASAQDQGPDVDCTSFSKDDAVSKLTVALREPNYVSMSSDNGELETGTWTLVYNQGMEVNAGPNNWWGFFDWTTDDEGVVTSHCGETQPSSFHSAGVQSQKWGCFIGEHQDAEELRIEAEPTPEAEAPEGAKVHVSPEYLAAVRAKATTWTVGESDFFEGMSLEAARLMRGTTTAPPSLPTSKPESLQQVGPVSDYPDEFNLVEQGFVPAVRNQAQCGSCFSFAATGAMGSNLLLRSEGKDDAVPAPQDVVSCLSTDTSYSQGCDGGFPYLVFKEGQDWGILTETCFPYDVADPTAPVCGDATCDDKRVVSSFGYVGDYYGGSTEAGMMQALMDHGAVAVNFMVQSDFSAYTGGVYSYSGVSAEDELNPFYEVNHSVLLVGWGTEDGTPYWLCQNSWGDAWGVSAVEGGEQGYFKILRGVEDGGECGIASLVSWVEMESS